MHFTLVFQSQESEDLSISICYIPCISWIKGKEIILTPHADQPNYQSGDLEEFLIRFNLKPIVKKVIVIVHPNGHGSQNDLDLLIDDLNELDFTHQVVFF
jgi:hypothetical protein